MRFAVHCCAAFALLASLELGVVDAASIPTPIHAYGLNNSLADSLGGPDITNNGATLGPDGLTFAANQGPSMSSWLSGSATSGNYSIEMYFSITNTSSYRKVVDFKNRTADTGLYNLNTSLDFFPLPPGLAGSIVANAMTHLVLTRDGATNGVVGFINGSAAAGISFNDGGGQASFTGPGNVMHFFRDDFATGQGEASAGFVDYIRIYDRALSAQEAAELYAARNIPEPGALRLATIAAMSFLAFRRRRTRVAR